MTNGVKTIEEVRSILREDQSLTSKMASRLILSLLADMYERLVPLEKLPAIVDAHQIWITERQKEVEASKKRRWKLYLQISGELIKLGGIALALWLGLH